jgi:hypothetical protein
MSPQASAELVNRIRKLKHDSEMNQRLLLVGQTTAGSDPGRVLSAGTLGDRLGNHLGFMNFRVILSLSPMAA